MLVFLVCFSFESSNSNSKHAILTQSIDQGSTQTELFHFFYFSFISFLYAFAYITVALSKYIMGDLPLVKVKLFITYITPLGPLA